MLKFYCENVSIFVDCAVTVLVVNINPIADASSYENAEPGKPEIAVETSVYTRESSSVVNFQESTIMNADDVSTDPEIKSPKFSLQNPKIKPAEKKATGKEAIWGTTLLRP